MRAMQLARALIVPALLALLPLNPAIAQTAGAPVPAEAGTVPLGRLGDVVVPSAYRLDLAVDPASPRFSGHVEIDATLKQASRYVYLHGRDLAMHRAVARAAGKDYPASWSVADPTGVALLSFAEPLPAGPVTLAFDYDAAQQDGPSGLFHVKVGDQWYSWSQFESIDARAAFPGFDQPGFKQPFTVTLRTPPGLMAVSNAPETGVERVAGMDVHHFAPTAPLPTYLLAVMVGPFAAVSGAAAPNAERAAPLPLRIISTRPNAADLGFALAESQPIIADLEHYFGERFPYPKLDQITAPIMPGAMENAGADLYEDSLLVLDDNASTEQKRGFGMVVAHELSHQWFGDLVTPAWWDDIWLNESFANWMGYRIGNEWRGELNIGAGALAEGFAAMNTDALLAGRPIHQAIERNSQIDAAFDSITYGKGGQVVAMIAAFMGDERFQRGVRRYMAAHRYGSATSADFFQAMADAAGDPRILPAMQSFTDQQGVPLLTFSGSDGHYVVSQSRYARLGTTAPPTRWGIPMCLRRGSERSCTLLDAGSASFTIGGSGPLMPNAGGTGYYRFELPPAEWDRLITSSASLPAGEALALADSLRASFMAGRASANQLTELARVMSANPDSYASAAALWGLQMFNSAGLLDGRSSAAYRRFLGQIYRPKLATYGFDPRVGAFAHDDPERSQARAQLVEQLVGPVHDDDLRTQLGAAVQAWLGGNSAALDPAWYGEAFDVYLEKGGPGAARLLLEKALASQDPVMRPAALRSLADTGNEKIARWLLDGVHDERLRLGERFWLVAGIANTAPTRDRGYRWIRAHVDALLSGSGGVFFAARLPQVLGGYCSTEKADAIAHDFGKRFAGRTGQLELDRTVERVRDCGLLQQARAEEASDAVARLK